MNFGWAWPQRLQRLRLKARQLARRWQTLNVLLRIADADARGIGQSHWWFAADVPVEGMLSWIEHQITTAPRPSDPAFDQFVVHLIPSPINRATPGQPLAVDTFPADQIVLRWDGERVDWTRSGRAMCAAAISPEHAGMLVVVWSMGAAAGRAFASPAHVG